MLISVLLLFVHLLMIPLAFGILILRFIPREFNTIILAYPLGLNIYFALFYFPVMIAFFLNTPFDLFAYAFLGIALTILIIGISYLLKSRADLTAQLRKFNIKPSFSLMIALLIIIAQAMILALTTYNDPDDSWFVSTSTTAIYTNTINQYDPALGALFEMFDTRRGFAPFPIFIAFIAKMTLLHPAIIAHTIFPLILIPTCYVVYYYIACEFYQSSAKADLFLLIISIINLLSGYSAKNSSIYLIGRIWQGKALLASLILPLLFLVLLWHKRKAASHLMLLAFIIIISSILISTTSVYLGPLLITAFMLSCVLSEKSFKPLLLYTPLILPYAAIAALSYVVK